MNMLHLEIMLIASLVAVAATLPGVFLVLRGMALMSDAISHAILLGIAIMFLIVQRLDSIWLMIGATAAGLLTVVLTEMLINTRRLKKDAAIGLVFPFFFSAGIILISQYARNVHLDADMVILGELAFAPFNRLIIHGFDCGPIALWVTGSILALNSLFVGLFYKELTLATFDRDLAYLSGFYPALMHYGLMTITSITAVGAFDIVGSIVVVALMITPPATAYLLTEKLATMLWLSILIGTSSAIIGCAVASALDVSIAGSIATACGFFFLCSLFGAPRKGLFAHYIFARKKNDLLLQQALCNYLIKINPEHSQEFSNVIEDLGLTPAVTKKLITSACKEKLISWQGSSIRLIAKVP